MVHVYFFGTCLFVYFQIFYYSPNENCYSLPAGDKLKRDRPILDDVFLKLVVIILTAHVEDPV